MGPPNSARAPGLQPDGLGLSDAGVRQDTGSLDHVPLLVDGPRAAATCGVALRSWWRLHAQARVPRPIKLGRRTLWSVAELRAWVAAGCPSRDGAR